MPQCEDTQLPSTFYQLEPGKSGHFLIITGPPCSGKSTTALQMAKKYGFKYYEGDQIFYRHLNPYLPLNSTNLNMPSGQSKIKFSQDDEVIWKEAQCNRTLGQNPTFYPKITMIFVKIEILET